MLLLATLPLGLSIVVTAPAITRSLYGSKFSGATPVLAVYGVVLICFVPAIATGLPDLVMGVAATK